MATTADKETRKGLRLLKWWLGLTVAGLACVWITFKRPPNEPEIVGSLLLAFMTLAIVYGILDWLRRRWIVAVVAGGLMLVGGVILVKLLLSQAPEYTLVEPRSRKVGVVRVSGAQLRRSLEARGVSFTEGTLADGRSRALGKSANGKSVIELIPASESIASASVSSGIAERLSDADVREGAALLSVFLKEAVPDWPDGWKWLTDALSVVEKRPETVEIRRSGLLIRLTSDARFLRLRVEQDSVMPAKQAAPYTVRDAPDYRAEQKAVDEAAKALESRKSEIVGLRAVEAMKQFPGGLFVVVNGDEWSSYSAQRKQELVDVVLNLALSGNGGIAIPITVVPDRSEPRDAHSARPRLAVAVNHPMRMVILQ